ncbi:MAG: putative toxin, partial [Nitrospira sp.]|nr:putative toxin [Nitrospira sp.]
FIQRDPNETGRPLLTALAFNGQTLSILVGGFDVQSLYGDGPNLYAAFGSNPIGNNDVLGLSWGKEDDIDDAGDEFIGHRVATIGFISEASGWALFATNAGLNIAGSLLGVDLFAAAGNILNGNGDFWDYVEVGAAVTGAGAAAWKAFKWLKAYNKISKKRKILRINRAVGKEFEELVLRTMGWPKNHRKISHAGDRRIPDVITADEVIEVKSEIRISLDQQLETIGEWARANGKKATLIVSDRNKHVADRVRMFFKVEPFGG